MADLTPVDQQIPPPPDPPPALPPAEHFFQSRGFAPGFLRVCLFLILSAGISFAFQWIAAGFLALDRSPLAPARFAVAELASLAGIFAAALIMARLEHRSFGAYGFPRRGAFGKLFWQGAIFGLAEITIVIGAMAALGSYHFGGLALHGAEIFRWALFWAGFFVVVGLYEEFSFRGYPQFTLAQSLGFWPTAIVLSVLFGLMHVANPGENSAGILGIILTGLFWSFTLQRNGTLWFAAGMHASFDFGETFLYSVPDSGVLLRGHLSNATLAGPAWLTGGSAGPEGSLFDFLALLALFFVFYHLYPAHNVAPSPAAADVKT